MGICLITKLKGVSNNSLLPKLGEWIIPTKEQTITNTAKQLYFYITAAAGTIVSAEGVTFTPVTLNGGSSPQGVECPNGNYFIHISDKYSITVFSVTGTTTAKAIFDLNLNELKYSVGLKTLNAQYTENVILDVGNLANLSTLENCEIYNNIGVTGDISAFAGISTLKNLRLQNTSVYGDISALNASASNLTVAFFENTGVTGDLANVVSFKKDVANSYLFLDNTGVTGTIESLATNIGPHRSSGFLFVGCAGTAITYQGAIVNRQVKITFNGTANPQIDLL